MGGQSEDEAALLALIHANRIAVWTHDYAAYEACFVHAPYVTRWNASRLEGIFVREGWDDISARIKRLFETDLYLSPPNAHETTVHNLQVRIGADMAWATFEQHYPGDPKHSPPLFAGVTTEVRFFERHGGRWYIAFWGVMDSAVGMEEPEAMLHLSPDGTVTWQNERATELLETDDDLVIRNGHLRIRDTKTNQKLQSAIRWAAERDGSLLPRRGAVPVLLEAGEDLPTKIYWVLAEGGRIVVTFGSNGVGKDRMEMAAQVFGLSPAQTELAGLVAEGLGLPEIAERMGITANTARTHLNRVYEKTGVRTQPALVRVLLSTASPV